MTESKICTCPSGDGSLRWPCPKHPAVEQAGGDERVVDGKPHATKCPDCGEGDLMPGDLCACGYETDPAAGYACSECDGSGEGCVGEVCRECDGSGWFVTPEQARAALAQPSPASDLDPFNLAPHAEAFNEAHDEALRPEQAEAERPEVVASVVHSNPVVLGQCGPLNANDELMTVAQHERILGTLRTQLATMTDASNRYINLWNCAGNRLALAQVEIRKLISERDAALARVAELEAKLAELEKQEPVSTERLPMHIAYARAKREVFLGSGQEDVFRFALIDLLQESPLYAAPVAQAQQLHDLDKQCRDDVARALGLRPNQERGFAWSYLLASIKSCVKASGDSAQAQHSVPVVTPEMVMAAMAVFRLDVSPFKSMEAALIAALRKAAAPGKEVGHE
ncbi:hypothetical protein ACOAOY_03040 [Pseudomonas aeruginosa]